jgi:hypothetical protein
MGCAQSNNDTIEFKSVDPSVEIGSDSVRSGELDTVISPLRVGRTLPRAGTTVTARARHITSLRELGKNARSAEERAINSSPDEGGGCGNSVKSGSQIRPSPLAINFSWTFLSSMLRRQIIIDTACIIGPMHHHPTTAGAHANSLYSFQVDLPPPFRTSLTRSQSDFYCTTSDSNTSHAAEGPDEISTQS